MVRNYVLIVILSSFCKIDPSSDVDIEDVDIVTLFAGAHIDGIVSGLEEEMDMHSWKDLSSDCRLWLEIKMSEKKSEYTARDVEVGAENNTSKTNLSILPFGEDTAMKNIISSAPQ